MENRFDARKMKVIAGIVLVLLFGIFLGKNFTPVDVWVFGWTPTLPLIVITLSSFMIGGAVGWGCAVFIRKRQEEE